MVGIERARYDELIVRVKNVDFVTPTVINRGPPLSIEAAMKALDTFGFHGASDPVEGAVWRIERNELANHRSEERRVGKECRYWRDWSSDVCSSDLWWVLNALDMTS